MCILIVLVVAVGLYRRWWVPGWLYQQERDERVKAETAALRNAETLAWIVKYLKADGRRRGASRSTDDDA